MAQNSQVGYVPVNKAGDTMTGLLVLSGDPATALGAATKQYVDAIAAGFDFKDACYAATTANLTATYANGASGVGATLVNAGALAAFSVDGVSPAVNSRILVKNQSTTYQNGIYTLTTVGSGAVAWELTRATDFDTPSEIPAGAFTIVLNGSTYADHWFVQTATVTTIGTDPITFTDLTPSVGANTALSNLAGVAINTTLVSDSDNVDDLGTGNVRWANIYGINLRTGTTNTNAMVLQGRNTGAATWTDFITITAGATATCVINSLTTPLSVVNGGTGRATSTTAYGTICAGTTATGALQTVSPGTSGKPLVSAGAAALPAYGTLGVDGGGTGLATATAYAVLCGGTTGTGAFQSIASVGTSGQVLTSNGAGALPTFQSNPSGAGAFVYLGSVTASASATVNFDNLLSATYDNYMVVFEGVQNATDTTWMKARFGTGGTPTYQTTNYAGNCHGFESTTNYYFANSGTGAIDVTYNNASYLALEATNQSLNGRSLITNANASTYKALTTQHTYINSLNGNTTEGGSGALWQSSTVITSIQYFMNGGNVTAGTFKLYGFKNS